MITIRDLIPLEITHLSSVYISNTIATKLYGSNNTNNLANKIAILDNLDLNLPKDIIGFAASLTVNIDLNVTNLFSTSGTITDLNPWQTTINNNATTSILDVNNLVFYLTSGDPAILMDLNNSHHQKRITCNDGSGNFNFKVGHYYDSSNEVYTNTVGGQNNGAANMRITTDSQAAGVVDFRVAQTGVPGSTVSWKNGIRVKNSDNNYDSYYNWEAPQMFENGGAWQDIASENDVDARISETLASYNYHLQNSFTGSSWETLGNNIVYENFFQKPMIVMIDVYTYDVHAYLYIGGTNNPTIQAAWAGCRADNQKEMRRRSTLTAIIPPGWYWKVTGASTIYKMTVIQNLTG